MESLRGIREEGLLSGKTNNSNLLVRLRKAHNYWWNNQFKSLSFPIPSEAVFSLFYKELAVFSSNDVLNYEILFH